MSTPTTGRPAVPRELKRRLYEESGYRCAIPTCKGTAALEMAHLIPWSEVQEHSFENMIVLCAVDHFRFDQGQIPLASIRNYKENLATLQGRYSDTENRVLTTFARMDDDELTYKGIIIPGGSEFLVLFIIEDGLVELQQAGGVFINGISAQQTIVLTEDGIRFVRRLRGAEPVS